MVYDSHLAAAKVAIEARERALAAKATRLGVDVTALKENVRVSLSQVKLRKADTTNITEHVVEVGHSAKDSVSAFYNIPAVKFASRGAAHLAWMAVYIVLLYLNEDSDDLDAALDAGSVPNFKPIEAVWMVFEVAMFLDQRLQDVQQDLHMGLSTNDWWRVWIIADINFSVCMILRFIVSGYHDKVDEFNRTSVKYMFKAYQAILSANVMIVFLLSLPFLGEWIKFSTLVIIVQEMVVDVLIWGVMFIIILLAFSFCCLGFDRVGWYHSPPLGNNSKLAPEFGPLGSFWAPLWSVHGNFDLELYG